MTGRADMPGRRPADPRCPLRPGEPCTLCHPEATGPQDCMTVALVMDDPDLRAELARHRARAGPTAGRAAAEARPGPPAGDPGR